MMESGCQVKGCRLNKKSNNINNKHHHVHHADINKPNGKENNNVNCSDDECIEEVTKKSNSNQTNVKKTISNKVNVSSSSSSSNTNTNNIVSSINNKNGRYANNKQQQQQQASKDLSYTKIVNKQHSQSEHSGTRVSKATTDLAYNKVVIGNTSTTDELTYNKVVSGKHSPVTTTTTTTNELSYNNNNNNNNKASTMPITNAIPTSEPLSYNKAVIGNSNKKISSSTESLDSKVSTDSGLSSELASNDDGENISSNSSVTSEDIGNEKPAIKSSKAKNDSEAQQRRAVLSYEQVCRLNDVMNEVVSIHGRGNFPTLEVRLRDLVTVVKDKLEADPSSGGAGMKVRDIRLNGGAASHVLATESQPYNDLDLIFGVELSTGRNYDKVKAAVLSSIFDLLPEGVSRKRITTCSLKEAYVSKMVKVNNDGDRWSLISLGNSRGHRNVELKFVDTMRRQFEFSVDSFQIILDSLLTHGESDQLEINETDCPNVVGESVYGDFHEALYHLQKKLISTRHPEEIRGGGLLKYCNLLVKKYEPAQPDYIKTLQRYMCSRFFIDFPDIGQQKAKLENYLWNHFVGPEEEALKYQYMMLLYRVVEESTVCLMGHERRQTLALIENLAFQVLCQEQQRLTNHQAPPPAYVYANGYYYAPVIPAACYTCTCNSWMACSS